MFVHCAWPAHWRTDLVTAEATALSPEVTDRWQARFRAPRVSLPEWAQDAPSRSLYASDVSGVVEQYAWDRETGERRQVTDRPNGTLMSTLSPDGETIWWFADTDGDEFGIWQTQPFAGGPDTVAVPEVEAAYPAGLEVGHTMVAIGRSTDDGSELWLAPFDGTARVIYRHADPASVDALTRDDALLVMSHSEHGDPRYPALRVLRTADDGVVAEKWDGDGRGLHALEFGPLPDDRRLLVGHERRGREELLIWDVDTDTETEIHLDLPGDLIASFYPDGSALLIGHDHAARSELYRYDLADGALEKLDTPTGVVRGASARPDGTVELAWSSSERPPVVRRADGPVVLSVSDEEPPVAYPVEDRWVPGPGGDIHALLVRPAAGGRAGAPPYATAFLVHGGPEAADDDSYRARRAAYVDAGYAVVHVNYRGSTGYGSSWRGGPTRPPGLTAPGGKRALVDAAGGA